MSDITEPLPLRVASPGDDADRDVLERVEGRHHVEGLVAEGQLGAVAEHQAGFARRLEVHQRHVVLGQEAAQDRGAPADVEHL